MVATETRKPVERILRYAIVFLAVVFLVEVVYMLLRLGSGSGWAGGGSLSGFDASPAEVPLLPPLDDFQELVDRSLFAWNRQPITPGKKTGDDEEIDVSEWHLSGVISHPEHKSLAIFVAESGDKSLALEEGMYLGDWKVESIDGESVMVLDGDKEQVMQLQTVDVELPEDRVAQQSGASGREAGDKTSRDARAKSGREKAGDGELTSLREALKKNSEK